MCTPTEETKEPTKAFIQCDFCKIWSHEFQIPEWPEGWKIEETPSLGIIAACFICKDLTEDQASHLVIAIERATFPQLYGPGAPMGHQ